MMSASTSGCQSRRIAAIAAAVQAYIDGEARHQGDNFGGMSAWRRRLMPADNNGIMGQHRSWTGRD